MIKRIVLIMLCTTSLTVSPAQRTKPRTSTNSRPALSLETIPEVVAPTPVQAAPTALSGGDAAVACCCCCGILSLGARLFLTYQQYTVEHRHAE